MTYRLLRAFEALFRGQPYYHRRSNQGDALAVEFYEDLYALNISPKLEFAIDTRAKGLGPRNKTVSLKRMRRGDGTLGVLVASDRAKTFAGYSVTRGGVATIDIGVEVKILNKAMQKQIDRVVGDLEKQVKHWRRLNKTGNLMSVAVIGINHADYTLGYEGPARAWRTDGKKYANPADEAPKIIRRIRDDIIGPEIYDEVLVLNYRARNEQPFEFSWVDPAATQSAYAAVLKRVGVLYEARF